MGRECELRWYFGLVFSISSINSRNFSFKVVYATPSYILTLHLIKFSRTLINLMKLHDKLDETSGDLIVARRKKKKRSCSGSGLNYLHSWHRFSLGVLVRRLRPDSSILPLKIVSLSCTLREENKEWAEGKKIGGRGSVRVTPPPSPVTTLDRRRFRDSLPLEGEVNLLDSDFFVPRLSNEKKEETGNHQTRVSSGLCLHKSFHPVDFGVLNPVLRLYPFGSLGLLRPSIVCPFSN